MKFLAFDHSAATEITASQVLQSVDYEEGAALAAFLRNPALRVLLGPRLRVIAEAGGVFVLGQQPNASQFVVVDLEASGLFQTGYEPELCLLDAQKLLRFAIKHWENLRLSASERIIPNSTKAVIFPHPISQQTNFRISIELHPDAKRQIKRAPDDRSVLVYRSGFDEGGGPHEEAPVRNFRLFLEGRRAALAAVTVPAAPTPQPITSLSVTTLDAPPTHAIEPYQGYDQWLQLLTQKQKAFVLAELRDSPQDRRTRGNGQDIVPCP